MRIRIFACALFIFAAIALPATSRASQPPYLDASLPIEQRVGDFVSRLTLEEKAALMNDDSEAIPRLNIKEYHYWNEALHGVARAGKFTVFPQAVGIAATWNPALVEDMTTAISDEAWGAVNRDSAQAGYPPLRFLNFWSPTINMARDPRWGRTPETYGEDPFLTSRIAVAFIKGMQGYDKTYIKAVATPKHFAANNEDENRASCNAKVSERALREYYFPAFKASIINGNAKSLMGAYNAVNGIPCNANRWLLTDVLRNEWGFDGFVVTDCAAVSLMVSAHKYAKDGPEAAAFAVNAGVDIECGDERMLPKYLIEATRRGLISEATIDNAVSNIIRGRIRSGMFDPPELNPYTKISPDVIGSKKHVELAKKVSLESIVLLENKETADGKLLPLDAAKIKRLVIVGPYGNALEYGDYSGEPANTPVTLLDGIRQKLGKDAEISVFDWKNPAEKQFAVVPGKQFRTPDGEPGLTVKFYGNPDFSGEPFFQKTYSNVAHSANNIPEEVSKTAAPYSMIFTGKISAPETGIFMFKAQAKGLAEVVINGESILAIKPEKESKNVLKSGTEVQFSHIAEPKLTAAAVLIEKGIELDITVKYIPSGKKPLLKLEWISSPAEATGIGAAEVEQIKKADAVIAAMGYLVTDEIEGMDRSDLGLPSAQSGFASAIASINPRVVATLTNGSPVTLKWNNIPAIVEWWYPGEQGGAAIADALFGDYNPAGRLPLTVYNSIEDLPPFDDYEIYKGRTYMYFDGAVQYPFGYGLSYTSFKYSNISVKTSGAGDSAAVAVEFDIANTGGRDGEEVAQVYFRDIESKVKLPNKKLVAFERIRLKAGETKRATLSVPIDEMKYWDVDAGKFVFEPGEFEFMVGASSSDIRLRSATTVE